MVQSVPWFAFDGAVNGRFAPDRSEIALALPGGSIQLWKIIDNRLCVKRDTLHIYCDEIITLDYAHDGESLVCGSTDMTMIWSLFIDGAVCIVKGGSGLLSHDGQRLAVRHKDRVTCISYLAIQQQLYFLSTMLSFAGLVDISTFCKQSILHERTRFLLSHSVRDILYQLVERTHLNSDQFSESMQLFPDLPLLNLGFRVISPMRNALTFAVDHGLKRHIEALLMHSKNLLTRMDLTNSNSLYFSCLPFSRSLSSLTERFPDLACQVLDTLVLDITTSDDNRGPKHCIQRDSAVVVPKRRDDLNAPSVDYIMKPSNSFYSKARIWLRA
jgi:hypothetical protein